MEEYLLTAERITLFGLHLQQEERELGTITKYKRDVNAFAVWLKGKLVTKLQALEWKQDLQQKGYAPNTINSMLTALNCFFRFAGWDDCRVKTLRLQKSLFRSEERELTRAEYERLLDAAENKGRERLMLLLETICATGIRVSEVQYITIGAAQAGRTQIDLKGKIRTILLPGKLCKKLLKYAKKQKITSGKIFLTRGGNGISRKQIWAEMKALCTKAKVLPSKVFPHNLRHLFARTYYRVCRDISKLADVLGHSSIETTRIYLISTGMEHAHQLERMRLIR